jgi:DNA-binding response OmpR family regulator
VARLRSKIEVDADEPQHIETVRGIGYRFNP